MSAAHEHDRKIHSWELSPAAKGIFDGAVGLLKVVPNTLRNKKAGDGHGNEHDHGKPFEYETNPFVPFAHILRGSYQLITSPIKAVRESIEGLLHGFGIFKSKR